MCRLSLLNKKGIQYIEKNLGGIEYFFNHLEKSYGGHGNGICIVDKNNKGTITRGVKLNNKKIAKHILNNIDDIEYVLYHTRLASIGKISDKNCHPFNYKNNVLMMNGTEYMYSNDKMTDTEFILRNSIDDGWGIFETIKDLRSVFIGIEKNKLFVSKGLGSLELLVDKSGAMVFASEFPHGYYQLATIYEAPKTWKQDETIKFIKLGRLYENKKYKQKYKYAYSQPLQVSSFK